MPVSERKMAGHKLGFLEYPSDGSDVQLREMIAGDLPVIFDHQQDPEATFMAAFKVRDPTAWEAIITHWTRILGNGTINKKPVLLNA